MSSQTIISRTQMGSALKKVSHRVFMFKAPNNNSGSAPDLRHGRAQAILALGPLPLRLLVHRWNGVAHGFAHGTTVLSHSFDGRASPPVAL